jgi:RNA polymerase sigma factor for flagellar operon FliA
MAAESASLWAEYRTGKSGRARDELIERHIHLAKYVVDRLNLKPSASVSYDDLVSQAVVGLIDAVERYDPGRGVKFETYAYCRIRGAVMDMLREMDWVPRSVRSKEADLRETYAQLEAALGRTATDEEAAEQLGLSPEEFAELVQDVGQWSVVSLEERLSGGEDEELSLSDVIEDEQAVSPEAHAERQDQKRLLAGAIRELPEKERLVISLYYRDGLTLKEIGRVLSVTESRVCQIHTRAVVRLQAKMNHEMALSGGDR